MNGTLDRRLCDQIEDCDMARLNPQRRDALKRAQMNALREPLVGDYSIRSALSSFDYAGTLLPHQWANGARESDRSELTPKKALVKRDLGLTVVPQTGAKPAAKLQPIGDVVGAVKGFLASGGAVRQLKTKK